MSVLPKKELKHLLSQGLREEVFVQLLAQWESVGGMTERYNAVVLLRGEFARISNDLHLNLIEHPTANLGFSRISAALLNNIDALPNHIRQTSPPDLANAAALRQAVEEIASDGAWQYDLFFSFSSKDLSAARDCCDVLRGYGLRVFFSADDLRDRAGHNFGNIVESALKNSRHFLLYCTPNAMESHWVEWEWEIFFQMCYLPNRRVRQFHIMEGPRFHPSLVPFKCQLIQRAQDAASILRILSGNEPQPAPTPYPLQPPSRIRPADKAAWDHAVEANSRAAFDWYVEKFPDGYYADQAHDHIAWDFAVETNSRAAFEGYLEKFPAGFYTEQALDRIDEIELDMVDWEIAEKSGSEAAYRKYLSKHPEGQYSTAVSAKISELEKAKEAAQEPPMPPPPMATFTPVLKSGPLAQHPRYQVERKLGYGGFTTVYLAWDRLHGLWVAVKVFLKQGYEGVELCRQEYIRTNLFSHKNIIRLLDFGDDQGHPFIVMPYYNEGTMQNRVGTVSEEVLWRLIHQVGDALRYLHSRIPPVVHNDLKPDNFLITDGQDFVLTDFGISTEVNEKYFYERMYDDEEYESRGRGPMAYLAPETFQYRDQRKQPPSKASEIWAFGVSLYELATGEVPFGEQGGMYQVMQTKDYGKQLNDLVEPLPSRFSGAMGSLIFDCLSPNPRERPSAKDLVEWAKSALGLAVNQ